MSKKKRLLNFFDNQFFFPTGFFPNGQVFLILSGLGVKNGNGINRNGYFINLKDYSKLSTSIESVRNC
jgi:predicted secreted protein